MTIIVPLIRLIEAVVGKKMNRIKRSVHITNEKVDVKKKITTLHFYGYDESIVSQSNQTD